MRDGQDYEPAIGGLITSTTLGVNGYSFLFVFYCTTES